MERQLWLDVGHRNLELIRSCVLLAAYLDGQEVDAGTASEIGYAAAVGLTCVGLRSDLRQSGEAGVAVNLQIESLILETGGRVVEDLDGLITELARLAEPDGDNGE
jgi:nucleoside 2-deoxyribosyltransferase